MIFAPNHHQHVFRSYKLKDSYAMVLMFAGNITTAAGHCQPILDELSIGIVITNSTGEIITCNRAAERLTGITSDTARGHSFDEIFGVGLFKNSNLLFKQLSEIKEDTVLETQISAKGKICNHVSLSISSIYVMSGQKIGLVLTLQDISRIKKLEEQANRAGRLAAMGEMAVKIAHEIRNPLGSIELFASMLQNDLENFAELKTLAEHISLGVRNINNIISNLLLFIKPEQKPDMQILDIHDPLKDSLFFAEHIIKTNDSIEVITDFISQPLQICGDAQLLSQISLNLILNAIQAMPDGGRLSISTRKIHGRQGDNVAEICFSDTGCGIPAVDLPKIFDPFFTTKKKGTGLGLTIVHNIVKAHGGTIDIDSSEASGTECILTFPLCCRIDGLIRTPRRQLAAGVN
jgi:PAS domain S-box-containing protein